MTPKEMEYVLESITLIYDSREHQTDALWERLKAVGFKYKRQGLKFGDYTAEYTLNDKVYSLQNECVIERKMSLDEICGNFTKGRARFEKEFEKAVKAGAKVHLIIENGNYEKILKGSYRSRLNSNSLYSSLIAFCDRYNITVHFCKPETTPTLMRKIFYHHIRNKLMTEVETHI